MLAQTRLSDFVEAVAAKTPTPGGGSVAAAVGAMGAALGVMSARFSGAPEIEQSLDAVKNQFLPLIDTDAQAYGQVNSAMALPKDSDDTKRRRKAALQNALQEASEVPLRGMQLAVEGLRSLGDLAPRCNKHLVSDLKGAAYFLEAALIGCGENVKVNASSLVDLAERERLEKEQSRLVAEGAALRSRVLKEAGSLHAGK
jgi:formiminotetrahydrofolate cyclodeaminase